MVEEWKDIPGYPRYQASSEGNIRGPYGILVPGIHTQGYYLASLMLPTGKKTVAYHRLVCFAFHLDTYFEGAMALHKDHDVTHNKPDNLYWGTNRDNRNDDRTNTRSNIKLTFALAEEIRTRRKAGERNVDLAKEFGVSDWTIANIIMNRSWKS